MGLIVVKTWVPVLLLPGWPHLSLIGIVLAAGSWTLLLMGHAEDWLKWWPESRSSTSVNSPRILQPRQHTLPSLLISHAVTVIPRRLGAASMSAGM